MLVSLAISAKEKTGDTLKVVQDRGRLICGVSQGLAGFSSPDDRGYWRGMDADFCRAVAAAVLGDKDKVQFIPLSAKERFTALQSGEIDLLSRNTTWTFTRDTTLGLDFIGTLYYDGQGFLVRKSLNVSSVKQLDGAMICTNAGTTTELNVADYFQTNQINYKIITFEKSDETVLAYDAGRCDAYSTDKSGLSAQRLQLKNRDDHILLPEIISKEPLGPVVRQGDDQWANIVRWTLFALINAEELGVNQANVMVQTLSANPDIQRMLGVSGHLGSKVGLDQDWALQVIKQVGNYADLFERNLGRDSLLQVDRGLNKLWRDGGILYAPPFR